MNKLSSRFLIAAAALFYSITVAAASPTPSIVEAAQKYLAAYSAFDMEKMAPLISDEMVFTDPTKPPETNNGAPFVYTGKDAVLAALGGYAKLYKEFSLDYDIQRYFESNGAVIFVGDITYNILTDDQQTLTGTAPIVTIITVNDGKIVEHRDYYDYAGNAVNAE